MADRDREIRGGGGRGAVIQPMLGGRLISLSILISESSLCMYLIQ